MPCSKGQMVSFAYSGEVGKSLFDCIIPELGPPVHVKSN